MGEKVVIFGATEMAMMVHFYLTHDSPHEVVAFTVDGAFLKDQRFCGLPVVPFEEVESLFSPLHHKMLVATFFGKLNRTRTAKYVEAKAKGYDLLTYVSSKAATWPGLVVGDNCLICEGSVINPFVTIGNNVVVAGSFIGHHSVIRDHCFIAANAVVLGSSTVEEYCFLGANSTVRQGIVIGRECIVGAGITITRNAQAGSVYVDRPAELLPRRSSELGAFLTWPGR